MQNKRFNFTIRFNKRQNFLRSHKNRSPLDEKPRSFFTLVELLVVIGIISMLAALLLPLLAGAKDTARTTTCCSNLKQYGAGMSLYASDYSSRLPLYWDGNDDNHWGGGWYIVHGPVGIQPSPAWSYMSMMAMYVKDIRAIQKCPNMPRVPNNGTGISWIADIDMDEGGWSRTTTYHCNPLLTSPSIWPNWSTLSSNWPRLSNCSIPENTIFMGDQTSSDWRTVTMLGPGYRKQGDYHGMSLNLSNRVFFDGRVETLTHNHPSIANQPIDPAITAWYLCTPSGNPTLWWWYKLNK